ncbi:MAG: hypothetical protein JWP08_3610, partial [Bryobacterales bacterium]|nr:hypothetical protein [Bryobacterales bacterium]
MGGEESVSLVEVEVREVHLTSGDDVDG